MHIIERMLERLGRAQVVLGHERGAAESQRRAVGACDQAATGHSAGFEQGERDDSPLIRVARDCLREDVRRTCGKTGGLGDDAFVLGGIWYGPLFKHAWCREAGVDPNAAPGHPGRVFGSAFVLALVAAFAFAVLLGPAPSLPLALHHGALVGGAFVATSFGINYAFAQRSLKLWLIDGGYHLLQFVLYGLILGLWH